MQFDPDIEMYIRNPLAEKAMEFTRDFFRGEVVGYTEVRRR